MWQVKYVHVEVLITPSLGLIRLCNRIDELSTNMSLGAPWGKYSGVFPLFPRS